MLALGVQGQMSRCVFLNIIIRGSGVAVVMIVAFVVSTVLWISGCSYTHYAYPMRDATVSRDMQHAYEELQQNSRISPKGKNRVLYYLEHGTIMTHMGNFSAAEASYSKASSLIDELYTESVTRRALSFVVNDATTEYRGEEYEIVALHMMRALLFLRQGQWSKAGVEARRINTRLKELQQGFGERSDSTQPSVSYVIDAFALYLSGIIFEVTGEVDSAIVDYRRALAAYEQGYVGGSTPSSLIRALYDLAVRYRRSSVAAPLLKKYPTILQDRKGIQPVSKSGARIDSGVIVISMGYPVLPKQSESFVFSVGSSIIRYSWPIIPQSYVSFPDYQVFISGKHVTTPFEITQNFDDISRFMLRKKRLSLTAKSITRIAAKQMLAHQLSEQNPLIGLMAQMLSALTETADTRGWMLLPGKIGVQRISLPYGKHMISYGIYRHFKANILKYIHLSAENPLSVVVLDYIPRKENKL